MLISSEEYFTIFNLTGRIISINGLEGSPRVRISPYSSVRVDYVEVQYDHIFFEDAAAYITKRYVRIEVRGQALTTADLIDLRYKNPEDIQGTGSGAGNPNGLITGKFGQSYYDTTTGIFYKCTADDSTVWVVI